MAVTNTTIRRTIMGNKRVVVGSTANSGTGGEIVTGLKYIEHFTCNATGGTAAEISVNEAFPLSKGDVTVVTESSVALIWMAIGR